jgi:hypothetical protein
MKMRNIILLLGILAIVAAIAVVAAAEREDNGTRAGEKYVGDPAGNCNACHSEKVSNWSGTDHADLDGDFQDKHGTNVYNDSYCGPCHTLGWNEVAIDGFDPGQAWDTSFNEDRWMIQCENCHGPAEVHLSEPDFDKKADFINLDRDPYISCYGTDDAGCHSGTRQWGTDEIPGWNASAHAPHDNDPETDHGMNTYCASCKSPSQWDPTTSRSTGVDIPKAEYRGITCGDCHDPHNDTGHIGQLKWPEEESCDVCHNGGHHETMRTEELASDPSIDREEYPYMEEVSCVECHMFQTGRSVPEPWKKVGHSFEPSIEACVECHTDVYDSMPDVDYDEDNATAMVEWDAWEATLDEALEEWGGVVEAAQLRHDDLLEEVTHLIEEVEEIMEVAEDNGTWTEDMEHDWEQAEYDWELAEHNARGAHNPAYGTALLNSAKETLEGILEELEMGTITGWVTGEDGAALANAYITVNGHGTRTDTNGMYMIELEPGTYDVSAYILGTTEKTVSDVMVAAAEVVTQNITLASDWDNDGTPDATDTDDDNDHLPDAWEIANGLDPYDHSDCDGDDDDDGMTNQQEFADQTDPQVADKAEVVEETDTTMYLVLIIVLIVIVVALLIMMVMKKGGAPKPESRSEPPEEEDA